MSEQRPERIAKVLARAGVCSRRDAERWVAAGRVAVDGHVLTTAAVVVTPDNDVRVDGKLLPAPDRPRLWRYHKPAGLVTTHRDEKGRPTVFDALPKGLPRLISIGGGVSTLGYTPGAGVVATGTPAFVSAGNAAGALRLEPLGMRETKAQERKSVVKGNSDCINVKIKVVAV